MNDFDNLEKKVLVKGDCGHYHPEDECEVVIVKIVKGKQCQLGSTTTMTTLASPSVAEETTARKEITPNAPQDIQTPPKKNILPPAVLAMMYPPGDPQHETKGAKEIRRV